MPPPPPPIVPYFHVITTWQSWCSSGLNPYLTLSTMMSEVENTTPAFPVLFLLNAVRWSPPAAVNQLTIAVGLCKAVFLLHILQGWCQVLRLTLWPWNLYLSTQDVSSYTHHVTPSQLQDLPKNYLIWTFSSGMCSFALPTSISCYLELPPCCPLQSFCETVLLVKL